MPNGMVFLCLPGDGFLREHSANLPAYDHFRPYFHTTNLKYSFGADKGRTQNAWQRLIVGMSPAQQISALEKYGFLRDLCGTRKGTRTTRNHYSRNTRASAGGEVIESQLKDPYCVVLQPSPNFVPPPVGPPFVAGWLTEMDNANGQRDHMSGTTEATVVLTNPGDAPVDKYATFYVAAGSPRMVTIQGDGAYQGWHVDQQHPAKAVNIKFTMPPGESRITFTTDTPPAMGQTGSVTFDIVNFDLTDSPQAEQ